MTARRRYGFLLVVAPAMFAVPAMAQSAGPVGGDPFANGTLSSINSGEVSTTVATASGRIEAGEFNAISVSAEGAQTSVKTTGIVSITPDPLAPAGNEDDAGSMGGGNMIIGTTSTTINSGNVRTKGNFAGVVMFGDRNSMSISSTGASTSYSISASTPSSTPGSTVSN